MKIQDYCKGDLVIITSGEYSDYGICALTRALRDFTEEDVMTIPGVKHKRYSAYYDKSTDLLEIQFRLQHLIDAGFVEELESKELHSEEYLH